MTTRLLGDLAKGSSGVIRAIRHSDEAVARRLLEMGLLEGSRIEIVHEAPFGGDPIAVRVRGALIAVRREEARRIEVEV